MYKTLVRVVAGGIGEGLDRLMDVTERLEQAELATTPDVVGPFATNPIAMAIVGFAYEFPEQVAAASASVSRTFAPLTMVAKVMYDTGATFAEATGLAPLVAEMTLPTRIALVEEFDRLVSVGSAEYARGRVLSVGTFTESVDGIVSYLSDSDEVKELVREQTLGITGAAVQEIRETGAAADGLTEGIFRKIFGKDIKPLPPKPKFEEE
jgi:hypothetical protein